MNSFVGFYSTMAIAFVGIHFLKRHDKELIRILNFDRIQLNVLIVRLTFEFRVYFVLILDLFPEEVAFVRPEQNENRIPKEKEKKIFYTIVDFLLFHQC